MMVHTVLHENIKTGLWFKWAASATKLENIMINPYKEKCTQEKFYDKIPDYENYLRSFGEMEVVCSITTILKKVEDKMNTCMLLGYDQNHIGGT